MQHGEGNCLLTRMGVLISWGMGGYSDNADNVIKLLLIRRTKCALCLLQLPTILLQRRAGF